MDTLSTVTLVLVLMSKAAPGGSESGSNASENVRTIIAPLAVPESNLGMVLSRSKVGSSVPVGAMAARSLSAVSAMFCAGGECQGYGAGQSGYVAAGGRDVIAARHQSDGRGRRCCGRAGDGEVRTVHVLDGLAEGDPPGRGVRVSEEFRRVLALY